MKIRVKCVLHASFLLSGFTLGSDYIHLTHTYNFPMAKLEAQ